MLDERYDYKETKKNRGSGILMHISSLPGPYGIGTLGDKAREFADFLAAAGQKYWQLLPVGPTGYGDSPYASFSSFAGNPYFIDLDYLVRDGLLTKEDLAPLEEGFDPEKVDYSRLYNERYPILKKAFGNFDIGNMGFQAFVAEKKDWLNDYAIFMALKNKFVGKNFYNWPDSYKYRDPVALEEFARDHQEEIDFQKFIQYEFFKQWTDFKAYVNERNIKIIGDLPIFVAADSLEIWTKPHLFQMEKDLRPKYVGGCPPDYFSEDGQLWGNPVYDWKANKEEGYNFWINRIKHNLEIFDVLRLDHFRGFESYWKIPYGDENARRGFWESGPAMDLFQKVKEEIGELSIIAEDLGYITEEVVNFRKETGFPSMKVLQFAFNSDATSDYLPHNLVDNSVIYTGTHDNDTIKGWVANASEDELNFARKYFNIDEEEGFNHGLIRGAMTSVSFMAIFQMQDFLDLGNEARMNNPGKIGDNWTWRMKDHAISEQIIAELRELTRISGRL